MRDYEILYILRPDLDESQISEAAARVGGLIESLGGRQERTNVWGKRRLAYEVGHFREGYYVLQEFQIEPPRIPELESSLKISDEVFRHLVVRRPEKAKPAEGAQPTATAEPAEAPAAASEAPAAAVEAPAEPAEQAAGEAGETEEKA